MALKVLEQSYFIWDEAVGVYVINFVCKYWFYAMQFLKTSFKEDGRIGLS